MDIIARIKNGIRHGLRGSMVGRALLQVGETSPLNTFCVVSATRLSEKEFWRTSALGRSLAPWRQHAALTVDVSFKNKHGLPRIYNSRLREQESADVLIFVHDDVWIDDPQWLEKLQIAVGVYDVVGVAGNRRISPKQHAWLFLQDHNENFILDHEFLSGGVSHGTQPRGEYSHYGKAPARCELLDGVFLALHAERARRSNAYFDERFSFDFYDMDFCRRAGEVGLRLGTWPIALTHQSTGKFGNEDWCAAKKIYFNKWGE